MTYPVALAVLIAATWAGFRMDGIAGAAWGLSISAPVLLALQLANLRFTRLLTGTDALRIFVVSVVATAGLALLAQAA